MRELAVDLETPVYETLEAERRLLGFESRVAYVRWIVDNRGSIGGGDDERTRLLEAHRRRIATLERRLETEPDAPNSVRAPSASPSEEPTGAVPSVDGRDRESNSTDVAASEQPAGGWRASRSDPTIELRGRPRTVRRAEEPTPLAPSTDGGPGLVPEHVVRIAEDPVTDDAAVLDAVGVERLDELSRRAVASTRERLGREVGTGLQYRSSTSLSADADGADLVSLESLSVPARTDSQRTQRRVVAGRALAYLRDAGCAQKADFVSTLYDRYPVGYATADGWWSFLKGVLKQVDAVDGGAGRRIWRYVDGAGEEPGDAGS